MIWALIVDGLVRETTEIDPSGRFHPSLEWVEAGTDVSPGWQYIGGEFLPPPPPPAPSPNDVIAERDRRLSVGFDYDFGDERGVHRIGTTPDDRRGWQEVTDAANAAIAIGQPDTEFVIETDTGPATITALEWQSILMAATAHRQPIWKASFDLQKITPIPEDYAADHHWP